ncbi:hypothetical protein WJX84_011412 [Apatococcus fuscideae]|uniref:Uncharacterized protein n=1 Tax=Apatococcus fuscideae TaxID=2026836 RepID=A0AAW1SZ62_9CHLO
MQPSPDYEKSLAKTAQAAIAGREVSSLMNSALPELMPPNYGRAAATMIRSTMARAASGFAITPKPSANLYILLQIPFEALLPAEVRRMVAPDSYIAPPPLHRDSYARDRNEGGGLQHDDRSPSLPLSEEAAPPLGERRRRAAKRPQSTSLVAAQSPTRPLLPGNEPPPQSPPSNIALSPSAQDALTVLSERPAFPSHVDDSDEGDYMVRLPPHTAAPLGAHSREPLELDDPSFLEDEDYKVRPHDRSAGTLLEDQPISQRSAFPSQHPAGTGARPDRADGALEEEPIAQAAGSSAAHHPLVQDEGLNGTEASVVSERVTAGTVTPMSASHAAALRADAAQAHGPSEYGDGGAVGVTTSTSQQPGGFEDEDEDDLPQYLPTSARLQDSGAYGAKAQNHQAAELPGTRHHGFVLPEQDMGGVMDTPRHSGWISTRAGRIGELTPAADSGASFQSATSHIPAAEPSATPRLGTEDAADLVGQPRQHGSESLLYQHGNPLFTTNMSGFDEQEPTGEWVQGRPQADSSMPAPQTALNEETVLPSGTQTPTGGSASSGGNDFHTPHSSSGHASQRESDAEPTTGELSLMNSPDRPAYSPPRASPAGTSSEPFQGLPQSTAGLRAVTGIADLYRNPSPPQARAAPSFPERSQGSRRSSSPQRGIADLYRGQKPSYIIQPPSARRAPGAISEDLRQRLDARRSPTPSGSGMEDQGLSRGRGSADRHEVKSDTAAQRSQRRQSPPRPLTPPPRKGARLAPEAGPSEPRLAPISVSRRAASTGLKTQQEMSPRSHARQVSEALAHLQAEHKQRFAMPGSAAVQPTADAASDGEAPAIGLQPPIEQSQRALAAGSSRGSRTAGDAGTSAYLNHKAKIFLLLTHIGIRLDFDVGSIVVGATVQVMSQVCPPGSSF